MSFWGGAWSLFGSLGETLSQLKVWGRHCQLSDSLREVCRLTPSLFCSWFSPLIIFVLNYLKICKLHNWNSNIKHCRSFVFYSFFDNNSKLNVPFWEFVDAFSHLRKGRKKREKAIRNWCFQQIILAFINIWVNNIVYYIQPHFF